jgi:hypothetical protein
MGVIRHACEKCAQGGSFASQIRQNERRFDSLSGKFETCSSASRTGSTLISVSLADDPVDRETVRFISALACITGKKTVAEFVETEVVEGMLRGMGIDYAQGFLRH